MAAVQLSNALRHLRSSVSRSPGLGDGQLLVRFTAERDPEAFAALVERHGRLVWSVCRNVLGHDHDAEDAFQATFLVLARDAGTIRKAEALANWLHGVAYRVAMRARRDAARRRNHERRAVLPADDRTIPETAWRQLQAALDEEVQGLPERLRLPFVLCMLEGRSQADVAGKLGWKASTVAARLSQARQELLKRLGRRGVSLPAALCAATLFRESARAAVPAALARSTVTAALAKGVRPTMLLTKIKFGTALLLLTGLLAAGVGLMGRPTAAAIPSPHTSAPTKPEAPKEKPHGAIEVSGRVLTPDGKPFPGAKLYLGASLARRQAHRVRAVSDKDGRFRFTFQASELDPRHPSFTVLALGSGYAADWAYVDRPEAKVERELRLVPDAAIRGRILDLNGRPIKGVTLRVEVIDAYSNVEAFFQTVREREWPLVNTRSWGGPLPGQPKTLTTGPDGGFTLKGVGKDRVVSFRLEGPDIHYGGVRAIARELKTPVEPRPSKRPYGPIIDKVYGATFVHAPLPSRPIRGVVRDARTGKPIAGAVVDSPAYTSHKTRTDKEGRYELLGYPKSETGYAIVVTPPRDRPYFIGTPVFPDTPGLGPIQGNVELSGGVLVKGRVTNRATGKPLAGVQVTYNPLPPNPAAVQLKSVPTPMSSAMTAGDGSYVLAVLPGPGVLGFTAPKQNDFRPALITVKELRTFFKDEDYRGSENTLYTQGPGGSFSAIGQSAYNHLLLIWPDDKAEMLTRDAALEPARLVKGTVLGPDGKPRAGALVFGLSRSSPFSSDRLRGDTFTVRGFDPRRFHHLVFLHQDRLGAVLNLKGEVKEPLTVRLAPLGSVTGRILDEDGQPVVGGPVRVDGERLVDPALQVWTETVKTDRQGRYRIDGLVPGKRYTVLFGRRFSGQRVFGPVVLQPGQRKDLGDARVKVSP
jgi:RNA polymerase sigma factor (sigma-70 family)